MREYKTAAQAKPKCGQPSFHSLLRGTSELDKESSSEGLSNLKNEPTSQWTIGWSTPTFMIVTYTLGLIVAIANSLFFHFLDGKRTDDSKYSIYSQTNVTALSTLMANMFAICMKSCLSAIFTQYLWRLVRQSPLRVMTLESLFMLRSEPLALFSISVLRQGWLLVIIAILIWVTSIAASFPPSAITVPFGAYVESSMKTGIPGLNVSNTWNGNTSDLVTNSFVALSVDTYDDPFVDGVFQTSISQGLNAVLKPVLLELAVNTMINGDFKTMKSPCGANCSYNMAFDGPYLSCTDNSRNMSLPIYSSNKTISLPPIFRADWTLPPDQINSRNALVNGSLDFVVLHAGYFGGSHSSSLSFMNYTEQTISCRPRRAEYEVQQIFRNNQQTTDVTIRAVHELVPLPFAFIPPPNVNFQKWFYDSNGSWGDANNYLRDSNIMALITTVAAPLLGSFSIDSWSYDVVVDLPFASAGDEREWVPISWSIPSDFGKVMNNTLAPWTRLFNFYGNTSLSVQPFIVSYSTLFNVSEAVLNSLLINTTLSTIPAFNLWNTSAEVTTEQLASFYTFSHPLKLILPYVLTLSFVFILLLVGLWALWMNGVSAIDGGFLQLLMTSRGSESLNKIASAGCLGGQENIPKSILNLEVMFGEFVDRTGARSKDLTESRGDSLEGSSRQDLLSVDRSANITNETDYGSSGDAVFATGSFNTREVVHLAGFGTRDEVMPLDRRRFYGK